MNGGKALEATQVSTAWVLVILIILIGIYDLAVGLYGPPGSTVSAYIHALARVHPVIPLLLGIILGHLFWPPAHRP